MGYSSYIQGELKVKVESNKKDCDFDNLLHKDLGEDGMLRLVDGISIVDENGVFTISFTGEGKLYTLDEDMAKFILYLSQSFGASVKGTLYVSGEDPLDLWRLKVEHNSISTEGAKVIFNDGSRFLD